MVKAVFVRQDSSADQSIKSRLSQLGKEAKNWIVVSSDREICAEAKSYQSRIVSSADFAQLLFERASENDSDVEKSEEPNPSSLDVDYWLEQFSDG